MRNHFLLLLLLLLFSTTLSAQFSIGPTAGIHLSEWTDFETLTDENGEPFDTRLHLGYNFGVVAEIGLGNRFFIQPQLHFIQKGASAQTDIPGREFEGRVWINYLDLVALAKYKYVSGPVGGYLAVGPQLGYGLSGKSVAEFTFNGETEREEEDLDLDEDGFNRVDFGFSFGGGLVVPLENGPEFFVDIRYLLGLTALNDDLGFDSSIELQNRGIGISIGVLFAIGSSKD